MAEVSKETGVLVALARRMTDEYSRRITDAADEYSRRIVDGEGGDAERN